MYAIATDHEGRALLSAALSEALQASKTPIATSKIVRAKAVMKLS
jgi:hypothetical protein